MHKADYVISGLQFAMLNMPGLNHWAAGPIKEIKKTMKRILLLFSFCTVLMWRGYSQDDQYYTDDHATVVDSTQEAPPQLPEYTQPPCPQDGYIWQPGYWAWGPLGYYWVPGVWVLPPAVGLLWTPGYWGWYHGWYGWHHGYWGAHIGYYGGINYGFGYYGTGFYGGRWEGGVFHYNTAVWRVNAAAVHNVYNTRVDMHVTTRASFNGPNGVHYRPSAGEIQAMHETHTAATHEQMAHHAAMANDRGQLAHTNHNVPAYHSMSRPGGQRFDARGNVYRGGGGGSHGGGGHGGRR